MQFPVMLQHSFYRLFLGYKVSTSWVKNINITGALIIRCKLLLSTTVLNKYIMLNEGVNTAEDG